MSDDSLTPPTYSAYGNEGGAVSTKKGLSLTSFILGLAAMVLFLTSWFAILLGVVAVVLGFIGRAKEPNAPRWMKLLGIIFGFVGIVLGAVIIVIAIAALAFIKSHGGTINGTSITTN